MNIKRHGEIPAWLQRWRAFTAWVDAMDGGDVGAGESLLCGFTGEPYAGWGESPDKIEAIIREDPEVLAMWKQAMHAHGGDRKSTAIKNDNVTLDKSSTGNSRSYTVSRLKSQRPDLFERVKSKELSANAAAIQAGWQPLRDIFLKGLLLWFSKTVVIKSRLLKENACPRSVSNCSRQTHL